MFLSLNLSSASVPQDKYVVKNRVDQASEKQGVAALSFLFSPVIAAAVPAAGAAAIGAYGAYGDELRSLYNSLFREYIYPYFS